MKRAWTLGDIVTHMEQWYPRETAENWDKVGLVLGHPDHEVAKVLLAVDPVADTVAEAIDTGCDLLITHHPLYLRGASFLPETDPKGKMVADLIRAGVGLYCAHTNADVAHGGVASALADLVGLRDQRPLELAGSDNEGRAIGLGRVGTIEPTTVGAFADHVASVLPAGPHGLFVGGDEDASVRTVVVSGGSGDHFLAAARAAGADAYLTADLRHHPASEHVEGGAPALLCGSHWATEWPWLPVLADRLRAAANAAGVSIDVEVSTIVTEPWTSHRRTLGGLR